ncbi:MAG: hypothetical protein ACI92Z_002410 [Paracoccaceae bacterium]|jgi:hypothetical protein
MFALFRKRFRAQILKHAFASELACEMINQGSYACRQVTAWWVNGIKANNLCFLGFKDQLKSPFGNERLGCVKR